jgi:hypothetical protein
MNLRIIPALTHLGLNTLVQSFHTNQKYDELLRLVHVTLSHRHVFSHFVLIVTLKRNVVES